jgi:multidrug efflux pump
MGLWSLSIRRPILSIVMSLVILIFGIISYFYLGVREYPAVDPPVVTVTTTYPGANPDIIESQITEPLEESISGIAGIRTITSVSSYGRSTIRVEFTVDQDLEAAANDVRDRVSRAIRLLPPDVDPPVVQKVDADAFPIIVLTVQSDKRSLLELTDIAINVFKERLQTIPGVSEVRIWGEKKYSMRIWMDPVKLAAYHLTPLDIRNALARENIELPSGRIEGRTTELTIRTIGRLQTPEDFNNLIIKESEGKIIRLRDVGYAELAPENIRTIMKGKGGIPQVGVAIIPQPGANHINIANEFYKRVEQLKKEIPPDIQLGIGFDTTKYIRQSVNEVRETILIAFGLVVVIIFFFLREWRATLIPIIAIPVSLIGAFFVMYVAGFSINVLTLLGLVLAIGMVVDDAIVVLENIYSKIERGFNPYEAGIRGTKEIFFAVIATTIALVAVFMPVIFIQGFTGKLFREFGVVIASSVVISSFVALTLTPMLSVRLMGKRGHSKFYHKTEPFFNRLINSYRKSLDKFMEKRWIAFVIMGVSAIAIVIFGLNLPSELAPLEDRGMLTVNATAPEGTSYYQMSKYMDEILNLVETNVPEAEAIFAITSPAFRGTGSNTGFIRIRLSERDKRKRSQQQIADELTAKLRQLTGVRAYVSQDQSIGIARGGLPVQFVIQAPNFEKLKQVLPKFIDEASKRPEFTVVDVDLKFNKPELKVKVNRERAKALGVSVADVAQTLQLAYSEQRLGFFTIGSKQYQVIGSIIRESAEKPADLKSIYVRNNKGELIQLDNLIILEEDVNPPQLYRFNRYISATVSAGLAPGKTIGDGIKAMNEIAEKILDETFSTDLSGPSRDYAESSSSLAFVMLLALILTYLVLSAQFESFLDPFIVMFTVPLALAGALFSLWYFNQTLNIFSQIGQIMLVGLVTKNGILIIEFANQRKAMGLSKIEAVKDAAVQRFRPILMTSLTTILAFVPVALALGAGAESRKSMGIAVIGGMLFSTILTLYVIPAIYSYLSSEKKRIEVPIEERPTEIELAQNNDIIETKHIAK